mmetsp:Transcript_11903/g.31269  ORF Transcript_11903/g.31269 Transcript_11903/m.31269 type:complete len:456 (-) Transcript_11903:2454-3821(-)
MSRSLAIFRRTSLMRGSESSPVDSVGTSSKSTVERGRFPRKNSSCVGALLSCSWTRWRWRFGVAAEAMSFKRPSTAFASRGGGGSSIRIPNLRSRLLRNTRQEAARKANLSPLRLSMEDRQSQSNGTRAADANASAAWSVARQPNNANALRARQASKGTSKASRDARPAAPSASSSSVGSANSDARTHKASSAGDSLPTALAAAPSAPPRASLNNRASLASSREASLLASLAQHLPKPRFWMYVRRFTFVMSSFATTTSWLTSPSPVEQAVAKLSRANSTHDVCPGVSISLPQAASNSSDAWRRHASFEPVSARSHQCFAGGPFHFSKALLTSVGFEKRARLFHGPDSRGRRPDSFWSHFITVSLFADEATLQSTPRHGLRREAAICGSSDRAAFGTTSRQKAKQASDSTVPGAATWSLSEFNALPSGAASLERPPNWQGSDNASLAALRKASNK